MKDDIRELADRRFANRAGVAALELIGSTSYGVDIKGSDVDYALKMAAFPIYDVAWERFTEDLQRRLGEQYVVEVRNKSVAILVEDTELEIVPFNGPFDQESVPFENLFGTPNDGSLTRAGADAQLKELFEKYPGARNTVRVAKAFFCPLAKKLDEHVPWGYLLTAMVYRYAKQAVAKDKNHFEQDFSGVDLFGALLGDVGSWPVKTRGGSLNLAKRWALNRGWNLDPVFQAWSDEANRITDIHRHMQAEKRPIRNQ